MERVYFDKQVFSYLFKGADPLYKKFLQELYTHKHNFLYCYSHAHMLDLKNDKTDIKFDELKFMETLVGDNYLSYHATEKRTSCYLATPLEVFTEIMSEKEFSFSTQIFDNIDLTYLSKERQVEFTKAKENLANLKLDFGLSNLQNISPDVTNPLSRILPIGMSPMSFGDWVEHFLTMAKSFEEDKSVYKGIRNVADKYINDGKFTIDYNDFSFNDDLKNSVLQKSFIEYVNYNLNPNGDREATDYEFYGNAYFTLDLLGISKEPSKSVRFRNVLNDGHHSYYGAFCDYVVSDDLGFLKKTKVMYKLLGIDVKVLHADEFIQQFSLLARSFEKDSSSFFQLLVNDMQTGVVLSSKPSLQSNRHTTTIKPYHHYLGHFNRINRIHEDGQAYLFLTRSTNNYSDFRFYREYEGIVNRAVSLFGVDKSFKGNYKWELENDEINKGMWIGRSWDFDSLTLDLEINQGTGKLCIMITVRA